MKTSARKVQAALWLAVYIVLAFIVAVGGLSADSSQEVIAGIAA